MSAIQPLFAAFLFSQELPISDAGVALAKGRSATRRSVLLVDYQAFLKAAREWALDAVVFGAYRNREGCATVPDTDADSSACWLHAYAERVSA